MPSLHDMLRQRVARVPVTQALLALNVLVFVAMLMSGAGFWHSPNIVQLNWGANFAPATQNGEWWRLGSAMFLHFGVMHLAMNMLALWDCGRLVERMFGHSWFLLIYLLAGLFGNLLSLVMQGNQAISGGASGAIFGIYGALIIFLWRHRYELEPREFKLFFGTAVGFCVLTIGMGFVITGIDNYAHIGGFVAGLLLSGAISSYQHFKNRSLILVNLASLVLAVVLLLQHLPVPKYNWRDEQQAQQKIQQFLQREQQINRVWQQVIQDGQSGKVAFEALANKLDQEVGGHYQESFDSLAKIPLNPAMPSAHTLENLLIYTQQRRDYSNALASQLRERSAAGPRLPILPLQTEPEKIAP